MRAITTLSPVIPGQTGTLKWRIAVVRWTPGLARPLQDLAFIHFAQWAVIERLPPPAEGEPWQPLNSPYLLFESNFDGTTADYLDAFADRLPLRIELIWSCCHRFRADVPTVGLPDGRRFRPGDFKRYVHDNELEVLHFTSAYPEATTRDLRQAVALRERLRAGDRRELAALALGPDPPRASAQGPLEILREWGRTAISRYDGGRPLIVATPIDPARAGERMEERLRATSGERSPLRDVGQTHFARLVVIPATAQDLGQENPDRLDCPYLLFTAFHDGERDAYLRALAAIDPAVRSELWGACRGYVEDPSRFAAWLGRHVLDHRYFLAGVTPPATARQLRDDLGARDAWARSLRQPRRHDGAPADAPPLGDVQGNVLHAYGVAFPATAYALLRVRERRAEAARAALAACSERVTFGDDPPALHDTTDGRAHLNVAFTAEGLRALGAQEQDLSPLPDELHEGAAERSHQLGDRAESAASQWEFGRPPAHVLLAVTATSEDVAAAQLDRLLSELASHGDPFDDVRRMEAALLRQPGTAPPERTCGDYFAREHFGFADGCSQPGIEGVHRPADLALPGAGVRTTRPPATTLGGILEAWGLRKPQRRWRGIALGEFIVGHRDEDARLATAARSPLAHGGTFMVYRKLEQDVEGFLRHTERASPRELDNAQVRARIVGRWADGTPLARSPAGPDPAIATDRKEANRFGFADDPLGLACPLGAHVRRTNPRDGLPAGGEATMRHRIIRRGMPYGPPYVPDGPRAERGLMFVCYSASIARGFETIQAAWCADGGQLGLGATPDYLLQQRPRDGAPLTGDMVLDHARLLKIGPPPQPFVITRGMEYLLLPGRAGLRHLLSP